MNHRHSGARFGAILLVASLAAAFVGGCKPKEPEIVGLWKDDKGTSTTFNPDKTFSQGVGGQSATGKWTYADKKVTITLEKIGNQTVDDFINGMAKIGVPADQIAKAKAQPRSMPLTVSEDGKTMTMTVPGATGKTSVTLTKVDAK